jgi:ribonucleotide monophosphatase NagD (HAD superfamily)
MADLDGVLYTEEPSLKRPLAKPIAGARETLQKLRAAGCIVVIYTARGWSERRVTRQWLADHGFEYDGLHMGKPVADIWIDDRAIAFSDWKDALAKLGL